MKNHYEAVYNWLRYNAPHYPLERAREYGEANYVNHEVCVKRLVRFYFRECV